MPTLQAQSVSGRTGGFVPASHFPETCEGPAYQGDGTRTGHHRQTELPQLKIQRFGGRDPSSCSVHRGPLSFSQTVNRGEKHAGMLAADKKLWFIAKCYTQSAQSHLSTT
jgi:hypothetical protein